MNELELLKKIPKEHFTLYKGKMIKVLDLLKELKLGNEKNTNNGSSRRGKNLIGR